MTVPAGLRGVCTLIAGPTREVWKRVAAITWQYPAPAYGTYVVDARITEGPKCLGEGRGECLGGSPILGGGMDWVDEGGTHAVCSVWRSTTSD